MNRFEEKPKIAVVCASNNNRSMAAHFQCKGKNIPVKSYGTGQQVKLPGKSITEQHVYDFGTPYNKMIQDLVNNDEKYYKKSGLIPMLQRNASIKLAPERFQTAEEHFDIVICYELRVYEQATNFIMSLNDAVEGSVTKPSYILNMNVIDNPTEAHLASIVSVDLLKRLIEMDDWKDRFADVIKEVNQKTQNKYNFLYSILFT